MSNWAELLPDMLILIVEKIDTFEDFVAFGGVCRSWRSVAIENNFNRQQFPWLMLVEEEESDQRYFFSPRKGMIHPVTLPEAKGKRLIGSEGWLVTIDTDGNMELLHPLFRTVIPLPHISTFKYSDDNSMLPLYCIHRAVLSASPSLTDDYTVMIIIGSTFHLAFWRPGDTIWTTIETRRSMHWDVIFHKGQFYALNTLGNISVCDIRGPDPTTAITVGAIGQQFVIKDTAYLVESAGDLLVVTRQLAMEESFYKYWTTSFRLFKFEDDSMNMKEFTDLGGRSIFLGHSACVSVPDIANCIYFTDDYTDHYVCLPGGGEDMGFYDMKLKTTERHYKGNKWLCKYNPPLWVIPSFLFNSEEQLFQ